MKKIIYIILAALTLASCNDWLEATSSTQFKAKEIYNTKEGFLDALSGVYINMGSDALYGGNITWKYNDLISYNYAPFTSVVLNAIQNHEYSSAKVKNEFSSTWSKFYNVIANINMILDNIDEKQSVFSNKSEFNWVKGELLGLRAFLHFDLMRLYGVAEWTEDNMDKLAIPYQLSYRKTAPDQLTYRETIELMKNDLEQAIILLADDPVTGIVPDDFDTVLNADLYWNNRRRHFNLYAAMALQARIALQSNDYVKAKSLAQEVIDAAFAADAVSWVDVQTLLDSGTSNDGRDWTYSTEHIFNLDITGLNVNCSSALIPGGNSLQNNYLVDTDSYSTYIFPTMDIEDNSGLEDIRGTACNLKYANHYFVSYKLYGTSSSVYRNIMPMIRISEMYYILAECDILTYNNESAVKSINEVRRHRGISEDLVYQSNLSTEEYFTTLYYENIREYINEGQLFYFMKRNFVFDGKFVQNGFDSSYNSHSVSSTADLTYPYPDEEINYGRVQEL